MANEQISYTVSATGAQQAAQAFDQVATSIQRSADMQQALTKAQQDSSGLASMAAYRAEAAALNGTLDTVGESVETTTRAFGASSRVIQEAGTTVGRLGAELGGLGAYRGVIDTLTRSLFLMGSTMVGGAEIAIAGGVVGAAAAMGAAFQASVGNLDEVAKRITTISMRMDDFGDRVKKLRAENLQRAATAHEDAAFDSRASVGDYKSSDEMVADQTAQRQAMREFYMSRINALGGGPQQTPEQEAAARAARNEQPGFFGTIFKPIVDTVKMGYEGRIQSPEERTTDNGVSVANARTDLFQEMEDHLRAIDAHFASLGVGNAISANAADSAEFDRIYSMEKGSIGPSPKASRGRPRKSKDNDAGDVFDDQMVGPLAQQDEQHKRDLQAVHDLSEWKNAVAQKDTDDAIKLAEKEAEARSAIWQKSLRTQEEAQKKSMAVMHGLANQGASMLAGAFTKMATAAVEGHKIQLKEILRGLGEQAIAHGTMSMFKGIIDLASIVDSGPGAIELATGAAELAFGLGLAGAGAGGGSPPSASGGSYAGSNTNQNSFGDPINSNNNTPPKTGPTVIYIDMPTVLSPSADDGMRIRQALQSATHVYGPQT